MGIWKSILTSLGLVKRNVDILCVGLDNSGKTTMTRHLQMEDKSSTVPTVGFSVELFERSKISFTVFDMSGQGRYRDLWRHYYHEADAVIWVIDSTDKERISVVTEELLLMLQDKALRNIPILFFANKMDVQGALTPVECTTLLQLERIKNRDWTICASNALDGSGIEQGLDWLIGSVLR